MLLVRREPINRRLKRHLPTDWNFHEGHAKAPQKFNEYAQQKLTISVNAGIIVRKVRQERS